MGKNLNVSIVLFNSEIVQISNLIITLQNSRFVNKIYLIDNSPKKNILFETCNARYIYTGHNFGFGAGHNLAIKITISESVKYHLVLNPDIFIDVNALNEMVEYMEANESVGMLMPKVFNYDGSTQLLPKLLPSPVDLLIRVTPLFKKIANKRSRLYVLENYQNRVLNVPIISGCFSIFRVDTLKDVGLYDERFFMYFEDFDLSRRIHAKYKTIYFPSVSIVHLHERGATKSFKLLKIFIQSAIVYFGKYGWVFDKDRKLINNEVLNQIK